MAALGQLWVEMESGEAGREGSREDGMTSSSALSFLPSCPSPQPACCWREKARPGRLSLSPAGKEVWFYFNFSFLCYLSAALTSVNLRRLLELSRCYLSPRISAERGKKNYPFEAKVGERESHMKQPANVKFGLAPICKSFKNTLGHFLLLQFFI